MSQTSVASSLVPLVLVLSDEKTPAWYALHRPAVSILLMCFETNPISYFMYIFLIAPPSEWPSWGNPEGL